MQKEASSIRDEAGRQKGEQERKEATAVEDGDRYEEEAWQVAAGRPQPSSSSTRRQPSAACRPCAAPARQNAKCLLRNAEEEGIAFTRSRGRTGGCRARSAGREKVRRSDARGACGRGQNAARYRQSAAQIEFYSGAGNASATMTPPFMPDRGMVRHDRHPPLRRQAPRRACCGVAPAAKIAVSPTVVALPCAGIAGNARVARSPQFVNPPVPRLVNRSRGRSRPSPPPDSASAMAAERSARQRRGRAPAARQQPPQQPPSAHHRHVTLPLERRHAMRR